MSIISLCLSAAAGVMLGLLFYGGLWITVRALPVTRSPVAMTLGSLVFRTAAVLAGVVLVSRRPMAKCTGVSRRIRDRENRCFEVLACACT